MAERLHKGYTERHGNLIHASRVNRGNGSWVHPLGRYGVDGSRQHHHEGDDELPFRPRHPALLSGFRYV